MQYVEGKRRYFRFSREKPAAEKALEREILKTAPEWLQYSPVIPLSSNEECGMRVAGVYPIRVEPRI